MDPQPVQQHDEREQGGRPQRDRVPPRYLEHYQVELYGRPPQPPQARAAPAAEHPETAMLRLEVAQLRGMVRDLMDRVEQYEQSYSEGEMDEGETQEERNIEPQMPQPLPCA